MDDTALTQLFRLARLAPDAGEFERLKVELGTILQFVTGVQNAAAAVTVEPNAGEYRNVFRADVPTHEPLSYTDAIAALFPDKSGAYLAVHQVITGGKHAEGGH